MLAEFDLLVADTFDAAWEEGTRAKRESVVTKHAGSRKRATDLSTPVSSGSVSRYL
jgi:hypothetical protein